MPFMSRSNKPVQNTQDWMTLRLFRPLRSSNRFWAAPYLERTPAITWGFCFEVQSFATTI